MGLLTCAKCGCSITAEMKKGKYVYYHCTNFRGECDNTYIRQEVLADRLADVIRPIQISAEVADDIAKAIRSSGQDAERSRTEALRQLDHRGRAIASKLQPGTKICLKAKSRRRLGAEIEGAGGGVGGWSGPPSLLGSYGGHPSRRQ